jgi:catechol 2,3-dioxygenase-like lactoylglutathione lyase family enzyme
MITGLNHVTLSIKDVEASFAFYIQVLGLEPVAKWPKGAYLLAGDVWIALILDEHLRKEPLPEYSHIAFTVSPQDFEPMCRRIRQAGTQIWQENWTEGDSLYFVDPNGHKLEIHASDLKARIKTARERPWEGLEFFDFPEPEIKTG